MAHRFETDSLQAPPRATNQPLPSTIHTHKLLLPILLIIAVSAALTLFQLYHLFSGEGFDGAGVASQLVVLATTMLLVAAVWLLIRLRRDLLTPIRQLNQWATMPANVPIEFDQMGELADATREINRLTERLNVMSYNFDEEVNRQTKKLAQKANSLQVLYDVAASLNASRDLKDLLTRFLHTMRDIVNARAGTVRLLNDTGKMELIASIGLADEVIKEEQLIPVQRCLCGNAVTCGEVLFQEDLTPCNKLLGRPMLDEENLEMIAVPLQYQGKNLGVYNLFVAHSQLENQDEITALFTSIGRHLGMAIDKARLDDEAKRLSIIQERNAIAHELHDSLAQTLASLRFQVSMLDEAVDQQGVDVTHQDIQQIKGGLDEAYAELRELLAHFRAPMHQRGLLPALEDLISGFRKQTGMHVLLQKEWEASRLSGNHEMQVLRIIQEALANIRKHSKAHTVRVLLRCTEKGEYNVLIEDDGVGLEKPAFSGHPGEHLGLSIMQERARYLGGELRIESEPGEGTQVNLHFHRGDEESDPSQHFALI